MMLCRLVEMSVRPGVAWGRPGLCWGVFGLLPGVRPRAHAIEARAAKAHGFEHRGYDARYEPLWTAHTSTYSTFISTPEKVHDDSPAEKRETRTRKPSTRARPSRATAEFVLNCSAHIYAAEDFLPTDRTLNFY